jgi:hypothetical protein
MSWPPPVLPTNRTNDDLQQNTHPADHNAANLAINDIVAHVSQVSNVTSGFLGNISFNQDALGWMPFSGLASIAGCSINYVGPYQLYAYPYQISGTSVLVQLLRLTGELLPNQTHSCAGVAWGPPSGTSTSSAIEDDDEQSPMPEVEGG